jgi:hypothetical protein
MSTVSAEALSLLEVSVQRQAKGRATVRFEAEAGDVITVEIRRLDLAGADDHAIIERARAMLMQTAVFGSGQYLKDETREPAEGDD